VRQALRKYREELKELLDNPEATEEQCEEATRELARPELIAKTYVCKRVQYDD
jgi:phage I-like protein